MPSCPNCRMEYRSGFTHCIDCDVDLVDTLPLEERQQGESESSTDLVELASFPNSSEAEMIRELLEDNDIRTVLRCDVDPIFVGNTGATGSTLLVEQADLEKAQRFYEDFFAGEPEEEPTAIDEDEDE